LEDVARLPRQRPLGGANVKIDYLRIYKIQNSPALSHCNLLLQIVVARWALSRPTSLV